MRQFVLFFVFTFVSSFSAYALEIGEVAPCVSLNHLLANGQEVEKCIREVDVQKTTQYKVLEFFSAVCSACEQNLPHFSSLAEEFEHDVTFRLVGIDRDEILMRNYAERRQSLIHFDVALDPQREAKRAYEVFATPTLFVLDADNTVVYKHVGVLGSKDIEALRKIFDGAHR